jgi:hypothetical protein
MTNRRKTTMKVYELLPALIDRPGVYATSDPGLVPGDHVKVGFRVDPPIDRCEGEWVFLEVTAVEGVWPSVVYRGELCNRPLLIEPAVLRAGQPIEFIPGHIQSVVRDSADRPRRKQGRP